MELTKVLIACTAGLVWLCLFAALAFGAHPPARECVPERIYGDPDWVEHADHPDRPEPLIAGGWGEEGQRQPGVVMANSCIWVNLLFDRFPGACAAEAEQKSIRFQCETGLTSGQR